MSNDNESATHGSFDSEEQRILSEIKPEDGSPVTEAPAGLPGDATTGAATTTTAEPAAAAPAADAKPGESAPAAAATTAAEGGEKPDAAVEAVAQAPQGDVRNALRASRRAEKRLREELDEAKKTIEQLKSDDLPADTSVSEEELQRLEQDFPAMAKAIRHQKVLEEQIQQLTAQSTRTTEQEEFKPLPYDPAVQMVIDEVPDLLAWQHDANAQDKFHRAIEYDTALAIDPDWKDKPPVERFAEAARRTREKFGMPAGSTPSAGTTPAAKPPVDPAAVIANAPATAPMGISDFRGGGPANAPTLNYQNMSDEAIMATLPVGD